MARKNIADPATRQRALAIAKSNPGMATTIIAQRLGVTPRQVQYWLDSAKKKAAANGQG